VVLHALGGIRPAFAEYLRSDDDGDPFGDIDVQFSTRVFLNGRERGFLLEMELPGRECPRTVFVACAEHASSDDIVVYHWVGTGLRQAIEAIETGDADGTKRFPEYHVRKVVNHIYNLLEREYKAAKKRG
jgi:hypothetical protein